jgi:hypothetical protein
MFRFHTCFCLFGVKKFVFSAYRRSFRLFKSRDQTFDAVNSLPPINSHILCHKLLFSHTRLSWTDPSWPADNQVSNPANIVTRNESIYGVNADANCAGEGSTDEDEEESYLVILVADVKTSPESDSGVLAGQRTSLPKNSRIR